MSQTFWCSIPGVMRQGGFQSSMGNWFLVTCHTWMFKCGWKRCISHDSICFIFIMHGCCFFCCCCRCCCCCWCCCCCCCWWWWVGGSGGEYDDGHELLVLVIITIFLRWSQHMPHIYIYTYAHNKTTIMLLLVRFDVFWCQFFKYLLYYCFWTSWIW